MKGCVVMLCACLILWNTPVEASAEKAHELETVVVTATKTPKKLENVPAVVTVIDQDEIQTMPARTVFDLIADLPGVSFNEPQGEGLVTPQLLTIRGQGFTGSTLILLDGQRIDSPFTNYAYLTTVPVRAVQRIEVIRGPFFRALRVQRRRRHHQHHHQGRPGEEKPHPLAGDRQFQSVGLRHGRRLRLEEFFLSVFFYDHKDIDNYYLYNDKNLDDQNRDYTHDRVHGKITGSFGDHTVFSFSGGWMRGKTGFGVSKNLGLDNHQDAIQPYLNMQTTSQILENLELRTHLDWLHAGHDYYGETLESIAWIRLPSGQVVPKFSYKPSVNTTDADRYRGDVSASYWFSENHVVTLGTEAVYMEAEKAIYDRATGQILNVQGRPGLKADEDDTVLSLYGQYDWTFFDRFELVLGGRFDSYDTYGSEFSPKATLRWNYWKDGNLKLSAGKGFRAPNLNELFSPPWTIAPFIVYQGNPDLEAETTWSYEASLEQYFLDKKFFFRLTPYYTKGEDFITSVRFPDPLNPGGQIMQPENIDKVEIRGLDLELAYYLTRKTKLFANYNYNETRDEKTDLILEGYPRNSLTLGLRAVQPLPYHFKLLGSYAARYRGEYTSTSWGNPPQTETVGDFWFHTVGLTLDWKDIIRASVDLYNIFNEREKREIGSYIPERNYIVGLSVTYSF